MPNRFTSLNQERIIRVFVSSTFSDMHAEREELAKRIFPQLRRCCEQRGVNWNDVDLRWGVTAEQRKRGQVLPVCLAEIRKCRPYFIGLLGERYGSCLERIPSEMLTQESWLQEHAHKSMMELEMLYAVLNQSQSSLEAFFYLRDPDYINRLPSGTCRDDFICQDSESRRKLIALKERIRMSG